MLDPVFELVFYVVASLEMRAEEREDPFVHAENDFPMKKIGENIRRNVEDILRCKPTKNSTKPTKTTNISSYS